MNITDAVHEFILYKQSLGMTYKNRALKLTAFARLAGPVAELKRWCEHNRNRVYVPEWLLEAWGIYRSRRSSAAWLSSGVRGNALPVHTS